MKKSMLLCVLLLVTFSAFAVTQIPDERGDLVFPGSINVKDYGAIGDGVHDDTAAIIAASRAMAQAATPLRLRVITRNGKNGGIGDGPIREIVFPAGTYRITAPLYFCRDIMLRGAGKVIIRQDDPAKDVFYFHDAFRCHVSNFIFQGGSIQCRIWTNNNESAHINIRNCQFINSSGPAVECFSRIYRQNDGNSKRVGPYTFLQDGAKQPKLIVDDRYPEAEEFYNSTQLDIDGCTWDNCMHAVDFSSDGAVIRNCKAVTNPNMEGGLFKISNRCHVSNVEVLVKRNPKLWQCVFQTGGGMRFMLDNSTFRTDNGAGICTMHNTSRRSGYLPTSIILRNLNTESAGCPEGAVVYFNGESIPSIVSIDGINDSGKGKVNIIASKENFNREIFEQLKHNKKIPAEHQFTIAIGKNSDNVNSQLPEGMRFLQQKFPAVKAPRELPQIRKFTGKVFKSEDYGIGLKDKRVDCTEALRKLFADAGKQPGSIVLFPARHIDLSDTVEVPADICIVGAGMTAFINRDEGKDLFSLKAPKSVKFSNVLFIGGKHALAIQANAPADVVLDNCMIYDSADYSVYAQFGKGMQEDGRQLKVYLNDMVTGTAKLYKGNATCWIDGVWLETLPEVPLDQELNGSCAIENHGFLQCNDLLGVPTVFCRYLMGKEVTHKKVDDFRWVDNFGELNFQAPRFGGEWSGICPIYTYGKSSVYLEGGFSWNVCRATTWPAVVMADSADADITVCSVILNITGGTIGNMLRKPGEKPQPCNAWPLHNCVYIR